MLSICMPYFDRQAQLDMGLESIRDCYQRLQCEIVICDDGSPEPPNAPGCVVVSMPKKDRALDPCVPINRAVAASSGDVIVLTNPEIVHREDVLTKMLHRLDDETCVNASCWDVTTEQWLVKTGVKNGIMPVPSGFGFYFCAMFTREAWDASGGFDEDYRYGQAMSDTDWGWRMDRVGIEFEIMDHLIVEHHRSGVQWPSGGLARNRAMFWDKWPHLRC